jgi:hypothetical protein
VAETEATAPTQDDILAVALSLLNTGTYRVAMRRRFLEHLPHRANIGSAQQLAFDELGRMRLSVTTDTGLATTLSQLVEVRVSESGEIRGFMRVPNPEKQLVLRELVCFEPTSRLPRSKLLRQLKRLGYTYSAEPEDGLRSAQAGLEDYLTQHYKGRTIKGLKVLNATSYRILFDDGTHLETWLSDDRTGSPELVVGGQPIPRFWSI